MKQYPDNFCILPWISSIIQPKGGIGVCCASTTLRLDNGVDKSDLNAIRRNESAREMRRQFLNGTWPSACEFCKKNSSAENRGHDMRRLMNEKYRLTHDYTPDDFSEEPFELQELELNFGNICNFKCRMCTADYSSKWITDAQLLADERFHSLADLRAHKGEIDILQLVPYMKNLKLLQVKGGEPFIHPQFKKLLKELIAKGISKTCSLYVITNGSIYDEEMLDLIEKFSPGNIAISVDGIEPVYSYIREGSPGLPAITKTLYGILQRPNIHFTINFTFQIYNMLKVYDTVSYLFQFTDNIILLPVNQDFLHFRNAPQKIKNEVEAQLLRITEEFKLVPDSIERFFSALENLREPRSVEDWKKFVEYTSKLDDIRGQDFLKIEPRFKPYFDLARAELSALSEPSQPNVKKTTLLSKVVERMPWLR